MEKKDWKKKLRELSFMKGYYFKLEDNGLVEKKDDQLVFNRKDLEEEVKMLREQYLEIEEKLKELGRTTKRVQTFVSKLKGYQVKIEDLIKLRSEAVRSVVL